MQRTVWTAVVLLTASLAVAQEDPGVATTVERVGSASPEEMLVFARDATEEGRSIVKSLDKLIESSPGLEGSGRECVQFNYLAAKSLSQVGDAAQASMKAALQNGQRERADHEFRKIAVALKKGRQLYAEAERCALGDSAQDGKTRVKIDGDLADGVDETREVASDLMDYGFDPPDGSPF
ncbi:MAG: hypothetical protein ACON5B_10240 [Myxococcota bacterium]